MIWSGSLLGLLAALAGAVPDAVEARVRAAIALRWEVDSSRVSLEWGRAPAADSIADSAAFRLLGGRDGRFVVALRSGRGEVAIAVRAGVRDSVWVTSRPVAMGELLEPDDLIRAERLVYGPPPEGRSEAPIGWEVRRALADGQPAVPPAVAEPAIIEAGQPVRFIWEAAGLRIVRDAIARTRARRGERVYATDVSGRERLVGIAIEPGEARLEGKGTR